MALLVSQLIPYFGHIIAVWVLQGVPVVKASIDLDIQNEASIKNAAQIAATGMLKYYTGWRPGDVPGNIPEPFHWWQAGAMSGAMIEYWLEIKIITCRGTKRKTWGMAAMSAAEVKFPNPPEDQPQWLALAQAVYNSQIMRWNNETCSGGLMWQIFTFNPGRGYKNTVSNGCLFNLASRLAVYTGNSSYADWAEKIWDWTNHVGLISKGHEIFDGTNSNNNCTDLNHHRWTYNAGLYLLGAAHMYHFTNESKVWKARVEGIAEGLGFFFTKNNVMTETICEGRGSTCNEDQRSFKAYLSRWMAHTVQIAPFTYNMLMPKLRASSQAAALQCNGPDNSCGLRWIRGAAFDGSSNIPEQMAALEGFQENLVDSAKKRVTATTGGISKGDPDAGLDGSDEDSVGFSEKHITTGDRVGAGILTTIIIMSAMSAVYFMMD